ncbi:MAG: hypothetical protein KDD82_31375, partial [Planctomycetes bacterium]|nr:hypothetical protein [Planctomycetota bacterium]
ERLLELAPEDTAALAFLAVRALERGDLDRAAALAPRLLEAAPRDWRSHAVRGRLRLAQGEAAGWEDLEHAVELAPEDPAPRVELLYRGVEQARWAEVRHHAQALLRLEGASPLARTKAEAALARATQELGE